MTLKELRMWHWLQVLHYRKVENAQEARRGYSKHCQSRDMANMHLSAVQCLNDSLPGTAENDVAQQSYADSVKRMTA